MARNRFLPLRRALGVNAVFSTSCGLLLLSLPAGVASFVGAGPDLLYQLIGAGLLIFALAIAFLVKQSEPLPAAALIVSIADLGWVAGSALLLAIASTYLSAPGIAIIVFVALIVGGAACSQLYGIYRVFAAPEIGSDAYRIRLEFPVMAPPEQMWSRIRDLGNIDQYTSDLAESFLRGDAEVAPGAVRECKNLRGDRWAEECTLIDDTHNELELRFLCEEPNFPFPVEKMKGGWKVRPNASGAIVKIWWVAQYTPAIISPFLFSLMHWRLRRTMGELVATMSADRSGPMTTSVASTDARVPG